MADIVILQYVIHLTDRALVEQLQGQQHEGGAVGAVIKAPDQAAIDYSAPLVPLPGGAFTPPGITSEWFGTRENFPTDEKTFERCDGGWFGICFLFGHRSRYYWRGVFEYAPPLTGDPGVGGGGTPDPIATRRWIDGFELPNNGEGGTAATVAARTASRSIGGYGFAMRSTTAVRNHKPDDFTPGLTPSTSWERFYLRGRVWPDSQKTIWIAHPTTSAAAGLALALTPSGQLALMQASPTGVLTLLGTLQALDLNTWYRIDILFKFGTGAAAYAFVNGVSRLSVTGIAGDIATAGRTHANSDMGSTPSANEAIDIDDWICADWPASAPAMTTPGLDWQNGSRIVYIAPTGYASDNVWTGDHAVLRQRPQTAPSGISGRTSTVSGAVLSVTTDADLAADALPGSIGATAFVVGVISLRGGAPSGTLGYKLSGGAAVMAAIVENGSTASYSSVLFHPAALTVGGFLDGLELRYAKAADVTSATVHALHAAAEVLGVFGLEDVYPGATTIHTFLSNTGIHNAPYPRSPWATSLTPPMSPFEIISGTYVGDAAGVTLNFRMPVQWLWVRRVTTLGEGSRWFSSMNAAHRGLWDTPLPEAMVTAEVDPTFVPVAAEDAQEQQYRLRITGANLQANNPGDTYAYLAICDPGMRFLICGALHQHKGTVTRTHPLQSPDFLPEAGFFVAEVSTGSFAIATHFYKGPGHAAASISSLVAAETANALAMAEGELTSQSAFHNSTAQQIAYAVFRRDDGSGDTGVPKVLQLASYTGDGSASRTIGLAPLSGVRPVFAIVTPHNAAAIMRDASHTGTTSTTLPATNNATTGITGGGIDSISVGSTLNASGIVYDVFVIPGSATAGNGGFSVPGVFDPVAPAVPGDGPWTPNPTDPDAPAPGAAVPDPQLPPTPAFPTGCIGATTQLINMALARLGHTKLITDVSTEVTVEATLARMFYDDVVNAVLRAFPWPFATRYATLAALAGTQTVPVNEDWTYSYRAPADQLFVRRFVRRGTGLRRTYDPDPVTFRMGTDATGDLIYTNAEAVDALVEYTARPVCAATAGDELFRSAVAWRLAHELAPGLSKDDNRAKLAWAMYERQIEIAKTVGANEQEPDRDDHDATWIEDRNS